MYVAAQLFWPGNTAIDKRSNSTVNLTGLRYSVTAHLSLIAIQM